MCHLGYISVAVAEEKECLVGLDGGGYEGSLGAMVIEYVSTLR